MVRIARISLLIALSWSVAAHRATGQGQSVRRDGIPASQVTCDIGPPATVPVEAAAAGFTHCVANFDFSQPTYSVAAYDMVAPAASHWADCFGEYPSAMWHGGSSGIREFSPCNVKQKIDPGDGSTVLNFEWLPPYTWGSQYFGNGQANQVSLMTYDPYHSHAATLSVGNYYVETTNRIEATCPSSSCSSNAGGPNDVYMYPVPGTNGTEIDIQEFQTNQLGNSGVAAGNCSWSNCGWTNWNAKSPIVGISNYSNLTYHTYGARITSDGKTDRKVCMWIDHVLQGGSAGCDFVRDSSGGPPDTNFTSRSILIMGASSNNGAAKLPIDFNVKNITLWSCTSYQTTMCNGSSLHTAMLPTRQIDAYYK
jgi:hypothetical protein